MKDYLICALLCTVYIGRRIFMLSNNKQAQPSH